jgi:hypothetical protein
MSSDSPHPSPFTGFEEPHPSPPMTDHPEGAGAFTGLDAPAEQVPSRAMVVKPVRRTLPWTLKLLVVLVPYAALLTAYTVYLMQNRPPHPLEAMGDQGLYGDYLDGSRRMSVEPTMELPAESPLKLGETRQVGALEVTPLRVTRGPWTFAYKNETTDFESLPQGLILHLKCKNISKTIFHPHDPLFNRAGKVYTFLTVGQERFYGPVSDPIRERIKGQDFSEYLPGDARETLIIAAPQPGPKGELLAEVDKLPKDTVLTWRVHLRRGQEKVSRADRLVWVTAVVPVQFHVADIQGTGKP